MKKLFNKIKEYTQWIFRKPSISFDTPLTAHDIERMVKEKSFYELRKILPQFVFGSQKLSRKKSLLFGGAVLLGLAVSVLLGNPLPFLFILAIIAWVYFPDIRRQE